LVKIILPCCFDGTKYKDLGDYYLFFIVTNLKIPKDWKKSKKKNKFIEKLKIEKASCGRHDPA